MENITVMKVLRKQDVEEIYVRILEDIYKESTAVIKLLKASKKILIENGKRDTIFLKLITAVLEEVFKNLKWEKVG